MKSAKAVILSATLVCGSMAFADRAAKQAQKVSQAETLPACTEIVKQCVASGFEPGDHKVNGKGLWKDCVGVIAKGGTVAGVTATADQAKACHAAQKATKGAK